VDPVPECNRGLRSSRGANARAPKRLRMTPAKLRAQRGGVSLEAGNRAIEERLLQYLFELRLANQKYRCLLRREFGTDGSAHIGDLRASIEARLGLFRKLRANGGPDLTTGGSDA